MLDKVVYVTCVVFLIWSWVAPWIFSLLLTKKGLKDFLTLVLLGVAIPWFIGTMPMAFKLAKGTPLFGYEWLLVCGSVTMFLFFLIHKSLQMLGRDNEGTEL